MKRGLVLLGAGAFVNAGWDGSRIWLGDLALLAILPVTAYVLAGAYLLWEGAR